MESLTPNVENPKLLSPLMLAYVGDGVYELLVRQYLCARGNMPMGKLHSLGVSMVRASAQSDALEIILPVLSEEEETIFKRGRNASSAGVPRHSDPAQYRRSTGIEALFGFLYLSNRIDRVQELFDMITSQDKT